MMQGQNGPTPGRCFAWGLRSRWSNTRMTIASVMPCSPSNALTEILTVGVRLSYHLRICPAGQRTKYLCQSRINMEPSVCETKPLHGRYRSPPPASHPVEIDDH